ncbi:MAG: hypothetical protein IT462_12990 [Planctomycetes bacterium]|nr:hypothetical protein [Planctomycetota bacterium]
MPKWPDWWEWELDVSNPHLRDNMVIRRFSEVDLRDMMENARKLARDVVPGRWIVETRFDSADWEVIVEPDAVKQRLIVVTAYEVY